MIHVTFTALMPSWAFSPQGVYFDGRMVAYISRDAEGRPYVCYKGSDLGTVEHHDTLDQCFHAVRCLATRIAYRQLMHRRRSFCRGFHPSVRRAHLEEIDVREGSTPYVLCFEIRDVYDALAETTVSPRSVPALARNVVRACPVALSTTTLRAAFFGSATYQQPLTTRNT